MKTAELTGAALDWAVAKCEDILDIYFDEESGTNLLSQMETVYFKPSTDWEQGGKIIERECITVEHAGVWIGRCWKDSDGDEQIEIEGATPLIAAMRCYVASKLGDEVELPEELLSCKYCGGNCMLDNDHACDGYLGDIDKLYAND